MNFKTKKNKLRKYGTKKRKYKGGNIKTVPITSILVNKPIINAIKSMHKDFSTKGLKGDPSPAGFRLSRLESAHNLYSYPIKVKEIVKDGKSYYSIQDGRHRFAKLAALGEEYITVEII